MTTHLEGVALLTAEPGFEGVQWVTDLAEPVWSGADAPDAWADSWQPLVQLFYDIGFLGISNGGPLCSLMTARDMRTARLGRAPCGGARSRS